MKRALLSAGILFLILGILLLVVVFMQSKEDFFIEADSFSSTFLIVIYYGQTPALLLVGGGIFVGLSQIIGLQEKKAKIGKGERKAIIRDEESPRRQIGRGAGGFSSS